MSVLEVVIIKNQVMKRAEIAEVEQNIKRENLRRRGKKKNGLEPCDFQERKMRQEGEETEGKDGEHEEEMHWRRMVLHIEAVKESHEWISARQLEQYNLEEQRYLAYGMKEKAKKVDDECEPRGESRVECVTGQASERDAAQPGGAYNGPRGAVACGREGGDECGVFEAGEPRGVGGVECGTDKTSMEDGTQPGGAYIGPRGAVVSGKEGGDECGVSQTDHRDVYGVDHSRVDETKPGGASNGPRGAVVCEMRGNEECGARNPMHSDGYGVECVGTVDMKGQRCAGTDMVEKKI